MTKEQEEAIEKLEHYLKNSVYKKIDSDSSENIWELVNLEIPQAIEIVLNILKQNSAELAEKSAEIEKKDKKDKIIDLMAERIEWLCKSNGILLDKEHDENFTQEDIKKHFERKVNE